MTDDHNTAQQEGLQQDSTDTVPRKPQLNVADYYSYRLGSRICRLYSSSDQNINNAGNSCTKLSTTPQKLISTQNEDNEIIKADKQ